jgi:pre-mRNA cleavage complex 2 protein Pcf11
MEAYALMDTNTRKKMDEMLKTWREPVPGSIDRRPVFPPEVTGQIDTALLKARTSALQAHQQYQRNQSQMGRGRPMASAPSYRDETTLSPALSSAVPQQLNAPPGYISNYAQPQYPPPQQYATPQPYTTPQLYPSSQQYSSSQPYPSQMNGQQQQYGLPQVCNIIFPSPLDLLMT